MEPQVLTPIAMLLKSLSGTGPSTAYRHLVWVYLATASFLPAQELMPVSGPGGSVRLFTSDAAILEAQEIRKDLPCTVTPSKAALGFDLKFHTGYEVSIPLKELAGSDNTLTMVFRVTSEAHPDEPVYLSQRVLVPAIEEDAKNDAYLQGTFDVGEGKYKVDWLMRDRAERVCSFNWEVEATLPPKDRQIVMEITPNAVQPIDHEPFKQEAPVG